MPTHSGTLECNKTELFLSFPSSMAISTFSSLLRYRKWAKSNWLVASLGLLLIVFSLSFFLYLTSDSVPSVDHYHPPITSPPDLVKLKLSSKAKERGACNVTSCLLLLLSEFLLLNVMSRLQFAWMEACLVTTLVRVQDLAPKAGLFTLR